MYAVLVYNCFIMNTVAQTGATDWPEFSLSFISFPERTIWLFSAATS